MNYRILLPIVALLLVLGSMPVLMRAQENGEICFSETPHCIRGRLAEFWQQNGGLRVFGLPITPQREEVIENQTLQVQWFERNRLELHPENDPPYDVLLGRLGADVLEQQGRNWYDFPTSGETGSLTCQYFPETDQEVCGEIFAAWRSNGLGLDDDPGVSFDESLALFGLPLSGEMTETLSDGREYTVQYFERARFEKHPENDFPYNVLLGLLGREILLDPETGLPRENSGQGSVSPAPEVVSASAELDEFVSSNGTLFFSADDGTHGNELWKSDGTPEGTLLVRDLVPGAADGFPAQLVELDGQFFFLARGSEYGEVLLWRSDGSEAGTRWVINEGMLTDVWQLTVVGDRLYFVASDDEHGVQVWQSDGSEAGTQRLTSIAPDDGGMWPRQNMPMGYVPYLLTDIDGTLFFVADDGERGYGLWRSDGTPQGTVFVSRLIEGDLSPEYYYLTNLNGTLLFVARTGQRTYDLWRSDGTPKGTTLVRSFTQTLPPGSPPPLRNYPHLSDLHVASDLAYFVVGGSKENGAGLWRSDGTPQGTLRLTDQGAASLTALGGSMFFVATHEGTPTLWRSDGTPEGTLEVTTLDTSLPNPGYSLISTDGQLYLTINGVQGQGGELWRSDGTPQGTARVKQIAGGWYSIASVEYALTTAANVENVLFLAGDDLIHGSELWKSDGTLEGTTLVKDINTALPDTS